jgi:hypothetical protein
MPARLTPEEKQRREQEKAAAKEITKIKKEAIQRVLGKKNGINWPCEIKIINKLVEKYPDIEFWRTFTVNFSFNLPSFAWFLTEKGNDYLAQEYRRQTTDLSALTRREHQELEMATGTVEKVEIKKKVLTLRDFLKYS